MTRPVQSQSRDLGCEVLSVLTPDGDGYDMAPRRRHLNLRAFSKTMVTIATLYNDLFSTAKEVGEQDPWCRYHQAGARERSCKGTAAGTRKGRGCSDEA
ncbi:hypothetical protein ACH4HG_41620 [Streptomyces coeruleorubidus]|uniref:hypothetical protein n=1 Tax=Streptomyces coeruleorubidus TaxID=116188 RepID=UPI0037B789A8